MNDWLSPYFEPRHYDSPYFFSGGISHRAYSPPEYFAPQKPKPKHWRCDYCKGVNLPDDLKCQHCNAPKITLDDKQQASVWGVSSDFIVKSHDITWRDKVIERISRLWNGLR